MPTPTMPPFFAKTIAFDLGARTQRQANSKSANTSSLGLVPETNFHSSGSSPFASTSSTVCIKTPPEMVRHSTLCPM